MRPLAPFPVAAGAVPPAPRLYWVDWLRFLAAVAVLLDHTAQFNWSGPELPGTPRHEAASLFLLSPIHLGRESGHRVFRAQRHARRRPDAATDA